MPTVAVTAEHYRARTTAAVVFTADAAAGLGAARPGGRGIRLRYSDPTRAADTSLRGKVLFGSDFPVVPPDRRPAGFADLPIRDEVRPLIGKQNAAGLLRLS
ncbi:hypothetical protein GCM10022222_33370 [Amycolatopsis ultiminotia]|uniref:Amidohydrolase-related domain-containing protein n=1 Tax=Amycolatopsis ultiminotia TaxID=543629 RepID=A0ABP6WAN4_9PSEU